MKGSSKSIQQMGVRARVNVSNHDPVMGGIAKGKENMLALAGC